jgi:imidazolonepropionase-like amidohydrolase
MPYPYDPGGTSATGGRLGSDRDHGTAGDHRWARHPDHPVVPIQFLHVQAALAVKEGLDAAAALRAVTLAPARVMGVDDRLGSLEPGKTATLCLWSGDPLDVRSRVEAAWIDVRPVL